MQPERDTELRDWLRGQIPNDEFKFAHVNDLTGHNSPLPTATFAVTILNRFVEKGWIRQTVHKSTKHPRPRHTFSYEWVYGTEKWGRMKSVYGAEQLWELTGPEFTTDDLAEFSKREDWRPSRNRTARYRMLETLIQHELLERVSRGRYRWTNKD